MARIEQYGGGGGGTGAPVYEVDTIGVNQSAADLQAYLSEPGFVNWLLSHRGPPPWTLRDAQTYVETTVIGWMAPDDTQRILIERAYAVIAGAGVPGSDVSWLEARLEAAGRAVGWQPPGGDGPGVVDTTRTDAINPDPKPIVPDIGGAGDGGASVNPASGASTNASFTGDPPPTGDATPTTSEDLARRAWEARGSGSPPPAPRGTEIEPSVIEDDRGLNVGEPPLSDLPWDRPGVYPDVRDTGEDPAAITNPGGWGYIEITPPPVEDGTASYTNPGGWGFIPITGPNARSGGEDDVPVVTGQGLAPAWIKAAALALTAYTILRGL